MGCPYLWGVAKRWLLVLLSSLGQSVEGEAFLNCVEPHSYKAVFITV